MKKNLHKIITFVLFIAISGSFVFRTDLQIAYASDDNQDIKLTINGVEKKIYPKILNIDGTIYFPVKGITKFLYGSFSDFIPQTKTIIMINKYGSIFTNKINTNILSVNGGTLKMNDSSFPKSGSHYITEEVLRTVYKVNSTYDEKSNTVEIRQTTETDIKKLPQELQFLNDTMYLRHYQPQYLERYVIYKKAHPELKYFDVVTYVNIGLDFPYYSGMAAKPIKKFNSNLVLCNKYNYLPEDYVPEGYNKSDGRVLSLIDEAQEHFNQMRADALKSGINIYIVSGYRSYSIQNQIYNNYKRQDPNGADTYSARPGYSEHQTGLAADLNSASVSSHFENTQEYKWLNENAYKYGFILRYPKEKEWITGYIFEPWHWRYVGTKIAEKIKETGLTYDEYYAIYLIQQNIRTN